MLPDNFASDAVSTTTTYMYTSIQINYINIYEGCSILSTEDLDYDHLPKATGKTKEARALCTTPKR